MCAGKRVIGAVLIVVSVAFVVVLVVAPTHAFVARLGRVFSPEIKSKSTLASRHRWIPRKKKRRSEKREAKEERSKQENENEVEAIVGPQFE